MEEQSKAYAAKVLCFYYLKYKGDDAAIKNAIKTKEDIPFDEWDEFMSKSEEMIGLVTYLDGNYPESLWTNGGPLVMRLSLTRGGKPTGVETETLIQYIDTIMKNGSMDAKAVVGVESVADDKFISGLLSHKIGVMNCAADGVNIHLLDGSVIHIESTNVNAASELMGRIANKLLISVGCAETPICIKTYNATHGKDRKIFAVPGTPGCFTNQLIKAGAHLCDSWTDLVKKGE